MGNTASSAYAQGIWRFHLKHYFSFTNDRMPSVVAEFGPGATLAACIAALCDGVDKAIALDACPYASNESLNLRMLDELILNSRGGHDYAVLRDAVANVSTSYGGSLLEYVAPCTDFHALPDNSLDFIFSHSVMEHVVNPAQAYDAFFRWLKPGGIISHKIDHSSHAITQSWNGHYAIPD